MSKTNVTHFPSGVDLMRRISALHLVRRAVFIPADLAEELSRTQLQAADRGLSFPIDYQIANYLRDLVKLAQKQIAEHDASQEVTK